MQNLLINRQIEIIDNRKIEITHDLMIWSMATPCWSWDRILNSVGVGKNDPPWAEAMDGQKIILKRKTRQISLINENSVLKHQINKELTVQNNKCDIGIFPLGYKTIDAISSRARG